MKKTTLLMVLFFAVIAMHAQTNLLTNPSFDTWTNGLTAPDGWTFVTPTKGTASLTTTNTFNGTGSALKVANATGLFVIQQAILPPNGATYFDPSVTYELRIRYTAIAGDGTDARIWNSECTSASGVTPVTYATYTHNDSILLYGPGGNLNPIGYASNNGYLYSTCPGSPVYANQWYTYVAKFKIESNVKQFVFGVRSYTGSTVLWDDFYFGEAISGDFTTAVQNPTTKNVKVYVSGERLVVQGADHDTPVMVYNALGSLVKNVIVGDAILLQPGFYVVKVGNNTTKVVVN